MSDGDPDALVEMAESELADLGTWDREVLDHLRLHLRAEDDALSQYEAAVASADRADVRYVARLLLEDELRHHRLLSELVNALLPGLEPPGAGAVPPLEYQPEGDPALFAWAERLLAVERDDLEQLHVLHRKLRPVAHTSLWSLIVDTMLADTQKHIAILQFIAHRARPQRD